MMAACIMSDGSESDDPDVRCRLCVPKTLSELLT
jgi:hypothetical protein